MGYHHLNKRQSFRLQYLRKIAYNQGHTPLLGNKVTVMSADGKPIQVDASTIQAAQNAQGRISRKVFLHFAICYKEIVNKEIGFIKNFIKNCIYFLYEIIFKQLLSPKFQYAY